MRSAGGSGDADELADSCLFSLYVWLNHGLYNKQCFPAIEQFKPIFVSEK